MLMHVPVLGQLLRPSIRIIAVKGIVDSIALVLAVGSVVGFTVWGRPDGVSGAAILYSVYNLVIRLGGSRLYKYEDIDAPLDLAWLRDRGFRPLSAEEPDVLRIGNPSTRCLTVYQAAVGPDLCWYVQSTLDDRYFLHPNLAPRNRGDVLQLLNRLEIPVKE